MNMYKISKGQLIVLWVFGALVWLWSIVDLGGYDPSGLALPLFFVVPGGLIFYTLGWRNQQPKKIETKKEEKKTAQIPSVPQKELKGLGGWLSLVAIGLLVTPLLLGSSMIEVWSLLSEGGLNSDVSSLLWFELLLNGVLVCFILYLIFLFSKERKEFPRLYILYLASSAIVVLTDFAWANSIPGLAGVEEVADPTQVGRALVTGTVWTLYMLMSKRVKNTFVK